MNSSDSNSVSAQPVLAGARASEVHGWRLWEIAVIDSTNAAAATLDAWHAVRADRQTAGRGRFQRQWVSDDGGLWLSAVVPTAPLGEAMKLLPLLAGLAVCRVAHELGLRALRMRWPNDIMLGDRNKLAGLLIDQPRPGVAVVGLGLNVINHPEHIEPSLAGRVARLADFLANPPPPQEIAPLFLEALRSVLDEVSRDGLPAVLPRINGLWGAAREVTLELDGITVHGRFAGVDDQGRLLLETRSHKRIGYEPHQVRLLRESEN
jgi:BirA family biotin operon repressor/biotin-[acetyl-CoA-carboxylase] ligase